MPIMTVNIIVIGGYNGINQQLINPSNIETWNNPNQADYSVLLSLYQSLINMDYNTSISAFDGMYPDTSDVSIIPHYKENFYLSSEKYFQKDAINIVVAFCPIEQDETWPTKMNQPPINLEYLKDYSFVLIQCGCMWDKGFPIETIMMVLKHNFTTPIYCSIIDSYLEMINTTSVIKEHNIKDLMKPFIIGAFTILGTLMYRGYLNTYESEKVIRELVSILDLNKHFEDLNIRNDLQKFVDSELIHWNQMKRQTRLALCDLVYGMETDYMI